MSYELTFMITEKINFHDNICAMTIDYTDIRKEFNKINLKHLYPGEDLVNQTPTEPLRGTQTAL